MRMLKFYVSLWLTFVTISAYANIPSNNVIVLGDSLSAAYGINPKEGWVNLLNEPLIKYSQWKVINASVSGETTSGGNNRLPALLKQHKPRIVIIELGGNDGLRGQPLNVMRQNLQSMIDNSKQAGAQVLLIGMQIPTNYGARYTREFKEIYPAIANKNAVGLVPFLLEGVATHNELMQQDGIHPNAKAQPILCNNVWPSLEKMMLSLKP